MSDKIIDVCYTQADIAQFEIGNSNITHLNKVQSLLRSASNYLGLGKEDYKFQNEIQSVIDRISNEKSRYEELAKRQNEFWRYIKDCDAKLTAVLKTSYEKAEDVSNLKQSYDNIDTFQSIGLTGLLDKLNKKESYILKSSFVLKGILENSSSKEDAIKKLNGLYKSGKISETDHEDFLTFLTKENFKELKSGAKDFTGKLVEKYLRSKVVPGVTPADLVETFKVTSRELKSATGDEISASAVEEILKYSSKFSSVEKALGDVRIQMKSLAFTHGVGVVTAVLSVNELRKDFENDVKVKHLSNAESVQNVIVGIGEIGAGVAGSALVTGGVAIVFNEVVAASIPIIGVAILVGIGVAYGYDNYVAPIVKEELREFEDWKEELAW